MALLGILSSLAQYGLLGVIIAATLSLPSITPKGAWKLVKGVLARCKGWGPTAPRRLAMQPRPAWRCVVAAKADLRRSGGARWRLEAAALTFGQITLFRDLKHNNFSGLLFLI